ncbi:DsbA family oxidoreductase [Sneathiella chinensis]|uniref:DSBA oxidoreductase n=1 Tax=Sneathiella chinensis TaxID=349750 RepID=A0ABQ5U572_9PROT|nr:DsbA family oxidoreductase [Sneathiella chinensis]GLQ07279.1 DSBA oxidoreductase [Sneathiella chinensis]
MKIDIVSDTVCPWCYIGKRKLEAALAQRPDLDVEITWHPFQLHPDMPTEGADRKSFIAAKFGSPERARELYDTVQQAGAAVGLDLNFEKIERSPNTLNSHRVIRWAESAGVQDALVEILFRSFFMDGKDLGNDETLIAAAVEAGMDGDIVKDLLDSGADLDLVRAEDMRAREMGISGVPFFILDNKYALSGAQDPAVILEVIAKIEAEAEAATEADPSQS